MLKCHFPSLWFVFKFWLLCFYFFTSYRNLNVWSIDCSFSTLLLTLRHLNKVFQFTIWKIFTKYFLPIFNLQKLKKKQYITAGIHLTVGREVRLLFLPLKWLSIYPPFNKPSFLRWHRCEIVRCPCFYIKSIYIYIYMHTERGLFFLLLINKFWPWANPNLEPPFLRNTDIFLLRPVTNWILDIQ